MTLAIPQQCFRPAAPRPQPWGTAADPSADLVGTAAPSSRPRSESVRRDSQQRDAEYGIAGASQHLLSLLFRNNTATQKKLDPIVQSSASDARLYAQLTVVHWLNQLEALKHGWNGYDAAPIDPKNIRLARVLAVELPLDSATTPRVVPMTKGRLQFEWDVADRSLELEITSPTELRYLKWQPSQQVEEEGVLSPADRSAVLSLLSWVAGG